MTADGQRLGLRIGGVALFAVLSATALATFLFPLVAGALRLGYDPQTNLFRSLMAWTGFAWGSNGNPAQWSIFWTDLKFYINGDTGGADYAGDPVTLARTIKITALLSAGVAFAFSVGLAVRLWRQPAGPKLAREHLRGARLLGPRDMPGFVAALVAKALFPKDLSKRRQWERRLLREKPTRAEIAAIVADADRQGRKIDRADAQADAHVHLMGDYAAQNGLVRFGSIPLPRDKEILHGLICASTGTGKSVSLRQLTGDLRRRGDRVIAIDAGYDLSRSFGRDDDLFLSPSDPRSLGWDLRNEVHAPTDWATLTQSVIPATGGGESAEWARKAQSFLTAICEQVGSETTNAELLKIATSWSPEALAPILADTPAAALLASGGERYLTSVRNNFAEKLAGWKYGKSGTFSLTDYMLSDDPNWLWLPYSDREKGIAGPAIAAWVDILVLAGLGRASQPNPRRTWIIIDELDSIGTIPGLKEAVTRLRKSNIAIVAAIQDLSQLVERYGRDTAQTLFGNFSNRLYLRCNASDLAEKVAREIGDSEVAEIRTQTANSLNRHSQNTSRGENTSFSTQNVTARLLLPSEIQNLPERTGFVKLAGVAEVLPVTLAVSGPQL